MPQTPGARFPDALTGGSTPWSRGLTFGTTKKYFFQQEKGTISLHLITLYSIKLDQTNKLN